MLGSRRSAPVLPRKPCSAGKDSWLNAQVRTGPRRICRGNRGPCQVFGLILGFAAPRRFCREHRAPCWFLGKMLRSAGSRFRSTGTGAPTLSSGKATNSGHNPVELFAILKFGSDSGARFDSKLQHSPVSSLNRAQLSAISRREICS